MKELEQFASISMTVGYSQFQDYRKLEYNKVRSKYSEEQIYEFAENRKILPFISGVMVEQCCEDLIWQKTVSYYRSRNETIVNELEILFAAFAANGIKKIFLSENFGALIKSKSDLAFFASGDVDIFADISQKENIYTVIKQFGYEIQERFSGNKLISISLFNKKRLPDSFYIGINWEPLSRLKLPCFSNVINYVDWNIIEKYKVKNIALPSNEALLYICILHMSIHSYCRAPAVRLFRDILNLILTQKIDWKQIEKFAISEKTITRVFTCCLLLKKIYKIDIPMMFSKYHVHYKTLLNLVYDKKNNILKPERNSLEIFLIEILLNDQNCLIGFIDLVYPKKNFIKEKYGSNSIFTRIKHILSVL